MSAAATVAIPADAAAWLRAHFDWTFGAIWVAADRYGVPAASVVAWAERLRAEVKGGARAGLGGKERAWIVKQLGDPEQQPTALERAMARTRFRGLEATPPLTIASIGDAIALLETRLADDRRDTHGYAGARELRTLLLDDLRILRDAGWSGQRISDTSDTSDTRDDTESERRPEMTAASTVDAVGDQRIAAIAAGVSHDDKGYPIREATCLHCEKLFTSRKYPTGWTSYCSPGCGAKGRYAHKATAAAIRAALPEPQPEPQLVEPTEPAASVTAEPMAEPMAEAAPAPAADAAETAQDDAADDAADETAVANGLAALWRLLTTPTAQPMPTPMPLLMGGAARLAQPGGITALPASQPTAPTTQTAEPSGDSLLSALLDRLPMAKTWTAAQRERWVKAFLATLDLEIETIETTTSAADSEVA